MRPTSPEVSLRPLFVRVLLVVAFLFAQHAALAHAISHAASNPTAAGQTGDGGAKDRLCDFHTSLGTVAGAFCGASSPPWTVDAGAALFHPPFLSTPPGEWRAPRSTGPPQSLLS